MGKEATATFIGHKECYGVQAEDVQREVEKRIASGVTDFLNGGMGGFDCFEKYHFKAAIPARNRYLVDNAAYALCYVTHGWGGAAQTLKRAQKKGLTIINLGERNDGRDNL